MITRKKELCFLEAINNSITMDSKIGGSALVPFPDDVETSPYPLPLPPAPFDVGISPFAPSESQIKAGWAGFISFFSRVVSAVH